MTSASATGAEEANASTKTGGAIFFFMRIGSIVPIVSSHYLYCRRQFALLFLLVGFLQPIIWKNTSGGLHETGACFSR